MHLQICGYTVPKQSNIVLMVGALHYNRHAWGEDAMRWRPQRWLDGRSKAAMKKAADGNPRFLPFLDGATNCIGQHLAMVRPGPPPTLPSMRADTLMHAPWYGYGARMGTSMQRCGLQGTTE